MEVDRSILGEVIESFVNQIKIEPAHPSSNRLIVHVKSSEKDIIDWAMRYGEYAVILEPDYLREEIRERAHLIRWAYNDENPDIEYQEQIKKIDRFGLLFLNNIDLNRQYTYRELTGIKRATFRRNGIKDFSFLSSIFSFMVLIIFLPILMKTTPNNPNSKHTMPDIQPSTKA